MAWRGQNTRQRPAPYEEGHLGFQTDCAATGEDREAQLGSVPPPIYESSLFTFPTVAGFRQSVDDFHAGIEGRPHYTRVSNPTVHCLEQKLALLEEGEEARAFGSGMAAVSGAILSGAGNGDHVVAVQSIYSGAAQLLREYLPKLGIETTFTDFTRLEAVESSIRLNTKVLYLESPGNPGMHLVDLEAISSLAHNRGLLTVLDNSMATPYNQLPLRLGIDLVVHSATKYLGGHSDVVAGAVIGSHAHIARLSACEGLDLGAILGPFEAWLILRGIRTLGVRMKEHNAAGLKVARWLQERPEIVRVNYPGLPSHPQHDLACRQMSGFSSLMSVVVKGGAHAADNFVNTLKLFGIAVSWGGFESLALPMDPNPKWPPELTTRAGIVPGMVRIYIGLEDVEDLLADLDQALRAVTRG